jgi:two-component system response regulator HydG
MNKAKLLIFEDELAHAEALAEAMEGEGYVVHTAGSGNEGLAIFNRKDPDVIVTDLKLGGDVDGLDVVKSIVKSSHNCEVIMITAHSSIENCKVALREGAYDFIEKPIDLDLLRAVVARAVQKMTLTDENRQLHDRLEKKFDFKGIIGEAPIMLKILDKLQRSANSDIPVLLEGETGVGKEVFAEAIHSNSPRKNKPFLAVNCAGLSESLLESELFGHTKGAFTGATEDRLGFFEKADGGTLFLDEIGDMPLAMQAKLLRVLEDQNITRVGSTERIKVDVRFISATNQNLLSDIKEKKFREDLYYRIRGVNIEIPPLRQRREDIPTLVEHFFRTFIQSEKRKVKGITPAALRALKTYNWPGNVREMRNTIKTMVVLASNEMLDIADLPFEIHATPNDDEALTHLAGVNLDELEKAAIEKTLELVDGNREKAATMLGIGERTLYRKIREYDLK